MIVNKSFYQWIYVIPANWKFPIAYQGKQLNKKEYLEYWGKWIVMDDREKLDELGTRLDPYVEDRSISSIKYNRDPEPYLDLDVCVMCIFCDSREREQVWKILSKAGVTLKAWVYERQTIEMWMPGGMLIENWIDYYKLGPEEGEKVRNETRQMYEKWLSQFDEGDKRQRGAWNLERMR